MKFLVAFLACCSLAVGAAAQTLPSEPLSMGGGRVVLGGDVAASVGPEDPGFFNYSDYEHSTLRELRVGVSALVRATDRISFLGEFRSENLHQMTPFALYARVRPFAQRRLDVQFGRIPPTFGRFTRQAYSRDNPLVGYPLAYQYLTSLRADAAPADPDELLRMRARGWLSSFSVGDTTPARGVPLVTAFTWDTGVQLTTGWRAVSVTGAITNGTPANPRVSDDNSGKQIATRLTVTPATGLIVGSSFARGQFLSRRVLSALSVENDAAFTQKAYGVDLEYSVGHWVARADGVLSEWRMPFRNLGTIETLRAFGLSVEGKYTFIPGAYAAARFDHLTFSRLTGRTQTLPCDAPVTRLEVGGGYYLQRNLVARASLQLNERAAGRVRQARFVAGQLLFWF